MYSAFSKVWWFHLPIVYERENQLYFYKWLYSWQPHSQEALKSCSQWPNKMKRLYSTVPVEKPSSWTNHFVEVSGHNLESSQTCGFCIAVLHHRFSSFTVYSNWTLKTVRGCVSLKKTQSQSKALEVTMNGKGENSQDFGLNFVPRIRPPYSSFPPPDQWPH